ncbi:hypothetical protein QYF36_018321 [Acer negundo]|nr:hypothetical protein QYF36_018321 [Acer negundo]
MDVPDLNVCYKNNDVQRARKRSRYLDNSYTDPMLIPKKKKKTQAQDSGEVVNENYIRFMSYLKKKENTRRDACDGGKPQFQANHLVPLSAVISNYGMMPF